MNAFIQALDAVLTIFILILIGYFLKKKNKINDAVGNFLSFFVVNITLPCSVFGNICKHLSIKQITQIPMYMFVVALSVILTLICAWLMAVIFKIPLQKKGSFITMAAFNNTIFMGLPVNLALFGEKSSIIVICYYIASTMLFWTVGIKIIGGKSQAGRFSLPTPLYGMAAGFLYLLINSLFRNFSLPSCITKTIEYMSGLTTPLSMIFTGYVLGNFGVRNIKADRSVILGIIGRFIVSPAILISIICFIPMSELARNVFIVQSFMPVMASQTIIARQYNINEEYPALLVTLSTLLSLVIIPIVKTVIA